MTLSPDLLYVLTWRSTSACAFRLIDNLDVKLHGNALRRVAGIIAASLISELAVDSEAPHTRRFRGAQFGHDGEVIRIDAEFLARVERKTQVLAGRIGNTSGRKLGGRLKLQCGWDLQFRFRLIGVHVEAFLDFEVQLHIGWLPRSDGCWRRALEAHINTRRFCSQQWQAKNCEYEEKPFHWGSAQRLQDAAFTRPLAVSASDLFSAKDFLMLFSISLRLTSPKAESMILPFRSI